MSFKSLFLKDDSAKEKEETKVIITFPETKTPDVSFPEPTAVPTENKFYDKILSVYNNGLESLNQPDVEFFELYKAVEAVDINNPSVYKMALQTLQTIDKNFTKEKALSTSKAYIDGVVKAHQEHQKDGISKREKLLSDKALESDNLTKEISEIELQVKQLGQTLSEKKMQLNTIDSKYLEPLNSVEGKLQANDMAKDTILNKLNTVIENLKTI